MLFAALLLVIPAAANAATFTVNNTSDATGTCPTPSTCSFRQALDSANSTTGDDTIVFAIPNPSTITLSNGPLPISPATPTDHLTVTGPGATQLTIQPSTATGPIFAVTAGTSTLSGMTITGGSVGSFTGAALIASGGSLTLDSLTITDNTANAGGNGASGAIVNFGSTMTIKNSMLSNNRVTNSGAPGSGGAIVNFATMTIINSTISGNAVTGSGGIDGGAVLNYGPSVSLTTVNATIANNSAAGGAGGVQNGGGAVFMPADTILASNTGSSGADCVNSTAADFASQGYNLIGNNTGCTFASATGDRVGTGGSPIDSKLGSLGSNGGATPTMSLLSGSPAINTGNPAAVSDAAPPAPPALIPCASKDQRGVSRPQGTHCDIGAFEFQVPVLSGVPTISGTPRVAQTLTCNPPPISNPDGGATTTSYSWLRNGTPISGATGQTYVATAADAGQNLTCTVTVTNPAGSTSATSPVVSVPPPPVLTVMSSKVVGQSVVIQLGCTGSACAGMATLTTREKLSSGTVIGVVVSKSVRFKIVGVGRKAFSLVPGQKLRLTVPLNGTGRRLLKRFGRLPVTLKITLTATGGTTTLVTKHLAIKQKHHHK